VRLAGFTPTAFSEDGARIDCQTVAMSVVIRDLLSTDISPAVRLLEECRSLPDTKPADFAQFVSDVSSGAPGVVAVDAA
jgi:hypothetical protein